MSVFGADVSGEDLLHALPALLGVLAAALRLLPTAVTSARGLGHGPDLSAALQSRVTRYQAPRPFSVVFPRRYDLSFTDRDSVVARKAMRTRTLAGSLGGAVVVAASTIAYAWFGSERDFPAWSITVAIVVGTAVFVALAYVFLSVFRAKDRGSAAVTQEGWIVVTGSEVDVRQHCLAALRDLGARLISMKGSRVLAATGVAFGGNAFLGEVIWVTIKAEHEQVRVDISCTKADFVSRSRSRRNVTKFLESWTTFPHASYADQGVAGAS